MSVVVIIDDHPENARLAARLLKAKHEVHTAFSGEDGLALVFDLKPDLVLVDLGLPDVDGQTIIAMVRQNPLLNQTRIVAFTAYPEEVAAEIARVYKCDGVIHKPINTRNFPSQVAGFLPFVAPPVAQE